MAWCVRILIILMIGTPPAQAEREVATSPEAVDPEPVPSVERRSEPTPSTARRMLAIGAAVFPGVLVRGAGSWVIGERRTAKRLFQAGLAGGGAVLLGALAIGGTGGSAYSVPAIPVVLAGLGLVVPTWFADIWVAAGGERIRGAPRARSPWTLELGTTWLRDMYRDRALGRLVGSLERGRLGLGARGLFDAEGDSRTAEAEVRWRILGAPATGGSITDGSRLIARAGLRARRDDTDDVSIAAGEVELLARLDLVHLDRGLGGMFLEVAAGIGVERASYAAGRHDVDSLLLGRFAWGAYLGRRSELSLFYDHRRDSLAGGLAAWRAAGYFGSFGAEVDLRIGGPWGLHGMFEVGNAYVTTLGIRYHGGSP